MNNGGQADTMLDSASELGPVKFHFLRLTPRQVERGEDCVHQGERSRNMGGTGLCMQPFRDFSALS
jgi:hypothetical protein